jgi:hypothetical protein
MSPKDSVQTDLRDTELQGLPLKTGVIGPGP